MLEYYMFHKPGGCITARRDPRHKTVMDYFPEEKRDILFPLGRLDKDTEGLLLVSNDGALWQKLMIPERHVSKTYSFWAIGDPSGQELCELEGGVRIYERSEALTAPAEIRILKRKELSDIMQILSESDKKLARRRPALPVFCGEITITEGKKHQVKRMIGYIGCRVVYLKRIAIGKLFIDSALESGGYRPLTDQEISLLLK